MVKRIMAFIGALSMVMFFVWMIKFAFDSSSYKKLKVNIQNDEKTIQIYGDNNIVIINGESSESNLQESKLKVIIDFIGMIISEILGPTILYFIKKGEKKDKTKKEDNEDNDENIAEVTK